MKRWIRRAACLYPAEWRLRYGAELDALLDDAPLRWRDLADVIRGAAIMQMTSWMTYWKMAALAGIAGAILAGGVAFAIPDRYVCTAALAIENRSGAASVSLPGAVQKAVMGILSRGNLFALLHDPQLDLYKEERRRLPEEQVADIFRKSVRVVGYDMGAGPNVQAFRIVFSYPDPHKAQEVVARLTQQAIRNELTGGPEGSTLQLLAPPVLPQLPTSPARPAIAALGALAGSLLGLIALAIWRRTRTYAVVTMSIPKDTKKFVDSQIAAGQFRSVGDYVRALIRADEQRRK
jgi:hypothetical protein